MKLVRWPFDTGGPIHNKKVLMGVNVLVMVAMIIQLVVVLLMVESAPDKSADGVQECARHAGWR